MQEDNRYRLVAEDSDLKRAPLLGVTGSIGSGKSAVCTFLRHRFSFFVLSADQVCRDLLEKKGAGRLRFVEEFGPGYLDAEGNIDRKRLREKIFSYHSLRRRLEDILHPLARKELMLQAEGVLARGRPVLAEVPLLFEAGWQADFDKIVVVYADYGIRLARVCERDGLTRRQAEEMNKTQMPDICKIMAADHVVDNSGTWSNTVIQLLHLGALYALFP